MKRWIYAFKQPVYAMSFPRDRARIKIESLSELVLEHVCKCILYRDMTNSYRHWVYDEIATWLSYINDITVKPKDKKLKQSDYDAWVFGVFGDTYADARLNLALQRKKCLKEVPPYPEVSITDEMIKIMTDVTRDMRTTFLPILSTINTLTDDEIGDLVIQILDKHCK